MMLVTTVILAGGLGTRIGGGKPLQCLRNKPLIEWVCDAVRLQSDEILISANENLAEYARLDCRVVADVTKGNAGPLAGVQAAMMHARNDWVASVPCDTPFLPPDLIFRLLKAAGNGEAAVAVVHGERQPAIALYRKSLLPGLTAFLAEGGRRVGGWLNTLRAGDAAFDDAAAFANINTAEELSSLQTPRQG